MSVRVRPREQFDREPNLTYLRARYYDPTTGTFISRDPVLGPLNTPIEHGEYTYARNNPVNLKDPSGKLVELVARKLQGVFGKVGGTHYYLNISPDNPGDFPDYSNPFTLGAYKENGKLVKRINGDLGLNHLTRSTYTIDSPQGQGDTDFINSLLGVYSQYDDSLSYHAFGKNSNSFAWSLLVGAGVDPRVLSALSDPKGIDFAPGWEEGIVNMIRMCGI